MEKNFKPVVGIIGGKGRMGKWFSNFFKSQGIKVLISDIKTPLSNRDLAQKADIVIVSVPISKTVAVIKEIRDFLSPKALLTDFTSLKEKPLKAMKKAPSGVLGMHPLFGPLAPSLENQKIVFCPERTNRWVKFLEEVFTKNGALIIKMSPEEHDRQMALIQALVHFANIGLARTLYSQKAVFKEIFLTPVFRLQSLILGRVLAQDPVLYAEMEIENPYFHRILRDFEKEIIDLASDVLDKNYKQFVQKFKRASLYLDGFRKIAQAKSNEILKVIEKQPIKVTPFTRKIRLDKVLKVGLLGPRGSFSHEAAVKIFGQKAIYKPLTTIREVFEKVNVGEVDLGVVPAENTIGGVVSETINALIDYPLKVSGSINMPIHHCLIGRVKSKEEIKIIRSHPQALAQCKIWLRKNLPQVRLEPTTSTTAPILETTKKEVGFIASETAARVYKLNILAKKIEDSKENLTKFYLITPNISKSLQELLKAKRTLLLLGVYDRVGILRDILNVFAQNHLNLTALHSIPSRIKPWDYFFFVEIEVFYPSSMIQGVIRALGEYCPIIRVLGTTSS